MNFVFKGVAMHTNQVNVSNIEETIIIKHPVGIFVYPFASLIMTLLLLQTSKTKIQRLTHENQVNSCKAITSRLAYRVLTSTRMSHTEHRRECHKQAEYITHYRK